MSARWEVLSAELDRWASAGRRARLWLRDDDAVEPTLALDRLMELSGSYGVPVALAVIPANTGPALARRLDVAPHASVAVHGWSHQNHAPPTEKKQELGPHRPPAEVLGELRAGLGRLEGLYGERLVRLLVPPWNRISGELLPWLSDIGFLALSVFGVERPAELPMLNTHVDLIDWHRSGGGRPRAELIGELANSLAKAFDGDRPVGLLTHHLVHDEEAWRFLEELFALTASHPGCLWQPAGRLIGQVG